MILCTIFNTASSAAPQISVCQLVNLAVFTDFRWLVHGVKPNRGADSQKTDLAVVHGQETEKAALQAAVLPVAGGLETEKAALQVAGLPVAGGQEKEAAALQVAILPVAGGQEKEVAALQAAVLSVDEFSSYTLSLCMISYFGPWIRDP
jgi:hypothetical protein